MSAEPESDTYYYRRAAGSSLLLVMCEGIPVLLHWGNDLGRLTEDDIAAFLRARTPPVPPSALDAPRHLGVLPESVSGFTGTPAVEGFRILTADDGPAPAWAPRFRDWLVEMGPAPVEIGPGPVALLTLRSVDPEAGLDVTVAIALSEEGLVSSQTTLRNIGEGDFVVGAVRSVLPVPPQATELLDLTGRWGRERSPQRRTFDQGTWLRAGRHGRTGHDATLMLVAGTARFGFRSGQVWGVHTAWSGDHEHYAERTPEGESLLGAGELLGPGEVVLGGGETYRSPLLLAGWSDRGLDGLSERFHHWTRRHRPHADQSRPRPVIVNTWEAAYFDHDLDRLAALADAAAEVGAERFVLDDGWFRGRRDDTAGLGDWIVDEKVWPDGLHPLVEHVRALGMDFGLWVEPEMVSADSDLARAHPEWLLRCRSTLPDEWRHQQVLDLQEDSCFEHVRGQLLALLEEYDITFLKWDHNRDLIDAGHAGRPAVHGQTLAFYRMLDQLRAAHPGLEVESCASGGGRVDLGVLARTDRIWPSDTVDALERQQIQRWTTLLVPPEMVGTHVGAPVAHTTGRRHRLGFRAATALIGHFGIEWDLGRASPPERAELAAWVAAYKQVRTLVAEGVLVRGDHPDPGLLVSGVVAQDRSEAVYVLAAVASMPTTTPLLVLLPGLDAGTRYAIHRLGPSLVDASPAANTSWLGASLSLPGSVLSGAGIRVPVMAPESAIALHLRAS